MSVCDTCAHLEYDEETDCYECAVNLDEDEYYRLLTGDFRSCPYYINDDEYAVVRKQI